ncbi:MAG: hypothetical protein JO362_19455 [Streptomycetaceae bacterium]|nr:hypothetical protein [Streptomycetaceae bacterium]
MTSIDVGGQALAVPAPLAPSPPLSVLLTDEEATAPLLNALTVDQLYDLIGWCEQRAGVTLEAQLKEKLPRLLHEAGATLYVKGEADTESPALRVELVTDPNYEDGVYWDDTVYFHHGDTTVTDVDFEGTEIGDALADYSRLDRPVHGSNLFIDLATGEISAGSRWAA